MHRRQMKKETVFRISLGFLLLILFALHVDAIFFRGLSLRFNEEISIEGIFSLVVTVLLALYVAHVVEEGREQKQSQNSLLEHIWQASYDSTKDIAEKLELKKTNYLYMTAWPKRMTALLSNAKKIIQEKDQLTDELADHLQRVIDEIKELRELVTTIKSKRQWPDDYLEINNNQISAISPERQKRAMLIVSQLQADILSIWTETVV